MPNFQYKKGKILPFSTLKTWPIVHAHSGPVKFTLKESKFNCLSTKKNCIEISVVVFEILTIFCGSVEKFRKECKKIDKFRNLGSKFFFWKKWSGTLPDTYWQPWKLTKCTSLLLPLMIDKNVWKEKWQMKMGLCKQFAKIVVDFFFFAWWEI